MIHYSNIREVATLVSAYEKDGRHLNADDLDILRDASIIVNDDLIEWVGLTSDLPKEYESLKSIDCSDIVCTPSIVDCHTHLVFGGDRAKEYTMRLNGADYVEIAKAGGGILNTMNGTNESSIEELEASACERIERLASYGVKTIEIKSGYGLNFEREKEVTLLIDRLKKKYSSKLTIINTFMAAHAVPKSFASSSDYLDQVVFPLLKELAPLGVIDTVDIFHEDGYFDLDDLNRHIDLAKILGIPFKAHVDEFNDNKGALTCANEGAVSCDHLLCTTDDGILALSKSKTVAVGLPGTGFFLGKPQANIRKLLDSGCKVAIGSDYNPGSCHFDNVLMIASMVASHKNYKLNICELWAAITFNSAQALNLHDRGVIKVGHKSYLNFYNCSSIDHITYNWGRNLITER